MSALKRVMIVEDDDDIATLATIALEEIGGLEVVRFSNGADALEGVAAAAPDFILLDYRMNGMNGDELLGHLRDRADTRELPVAFMTASLMPSHIERLRQLGALDVIAKPFDPLSLADQVRAVWDKRNG